MVRTRATTVPTPARQGASEPTIGVVTRGGAVARGRGRGHRRTPTRGRGQTPGPARNRVVTPPPTDEVVREGEEGKNEQGYTPPVFSAPPPQVQGVQHAAAMTPCMDASFEYSRVLNSEDAYDFLVDCHELLHKMDIVEQFSIEFVTYQFQGDAKMWWCSYVEYQPARAPPMTWASFSSLFMEKYIPRTLRDRRRDECLSLEQRKMSVAAYEAKFCALSRYATQLCFSPQERIRRFVKGLRSDLQILALQVAAAAKSFQEVVDFVIEVDGVKPDDFTTASTFKKFRKGAGGPSQTSQPFSEFGGYLQTSSFSQIPILDSRNCYGCGEVGHIRKYCPKQSYIPPVVRGRGGHGRGCHSGGRGGQGNGGHQFGRGGGKVGTTTVQLGRGDRTHCYAFPGRSEAETSDVVITEKRGFLACVEARSSFLDTIKGNQFADEKLSRIRDMVLPGEAKEAAMDEEGVLRIKGRVCVPRVDNLIHTILIEANSSRLTKSAHFIPVKMTYNAEKLAKLYVSEIVRLHGVPLSIISYRGTQFTSKFWRTLHVELGTRQDLSTAFHPQTDGQPE
ncbi:uncharacterized protein [Solanum lycopersicum]|uniref:uncharacterized protein n=1 Tax=Solanum lycopersicum TaxID=4081 RepID=UPI0037492BE7